MEGYEVENEKGEKAWWDGKQLLPIPKPSAAQPSGVAPVTAQPPRFPTAEGVAQRWAGPIATGAVGLATAPVSIPAQMAIGAATEAVGQKLGGKELDPVAIGGAALLPPAVRGVAQAGKGIVRSVANQVSRQPMVEAAVQKLEKMVGIGKAGTEAVEAVKKNPLPVDDFPNTSKILDDILAKEDKIPGGSKKAIDVAIDTYDKLTKPGQKFNYGEIFESTSALRETAEAAGDNRTMKRVYDIRQGLIDDISALSPEAKQAFALYRKQQSVKDIAKVMRSGGFTQNKVAQLFEDPLIAGAFTTAERKVIDTISSQVGPEGLTKILSIIGTLAAKGGTALTLPLLISGLISVPKVGAVFARSLIGPEGEVSKAALPAFAQFMRGYLASQGDAK